MCRLEIERETVVSVGGRVCGSDGSETVQYDMMLEELMEWQRRETYLDLYIRLTSYLVLVPL